MQKKMNVKRSQGNFLSHRGAYGEQKLTKSSLDRRFFCSVSSFEMAFRQGIFEYLPQLNLQNMIYQAPIALDVENRTVQAIIDLDTGLIGFTEKMGDETVEYYYGESPREFKLAFLKKLEALFAEKSLANMKICRKNRMVMEWEKLLTGNK